MGPEADATARGQIHSGPEWGGADGDDNDEDRDRDLMLVTVMVAAVMTATMTTGHDDDSRRSFSNSGQKTSLSGDAQNICEN